MDATTALLNAALAQHQSEQQQNAAQQDQTVNILNSAQNEPYATPAPQAPQTVSANNAPEMGFGGYLGHFVTGGLADKLAAAVGATGQPYLNMGPNSVNGDNWSDRYHKTLTNIRNSAQEYENVHPDAAKAAKAVGVAGQVLAPEMRAGGLLDATGQVAANAPSLLRSMTTGGAYGGAYGFGGTNDNSFAEDALNTGAGMVTGVGAGLGGHAVGSLLGKGVGAVSDLVSANPQTKGQKLAAAMLMDKMGQQGVTVPDIQSVLSNTTKPLTVMDIGGENAPLQRLGRTVVTLPGEGGQQVTDFLNQRQDSQRGRVLGDISQHLAPNTDTYGTAADLRAEQALTHPLYQQAFDAPANPTDQLNMLQNHPDVQRGMREGIAAQSRYAAGRGIPFDPNAYGVTGFNPAGDPIIGPTPNWRTWHAARMGLDNVIDSMRNPITNELPNSAGSWIALRSGLDKQLKAANPSFVDADADFADPAQQLDAMNRGQKFLNADPEQITTAQDRMTPDAIEAHRVGAGRALRDTANDAKDTADISKRLLGDQTTRDQLSAMFGQDAANNFGANIGDEGTMANTRRFVTGNSSTANKAADVADANKPSLMGQLLGDAIEGGIASGSLRGALTLPALRAANQVRARVTSGIVNNEPRNLELAKVLTGTGATGIQNLESLIVPAQRRVAISNMAKRIGGAAGAGSVSPLASYLIPQAANAGR